MQTDPSSGTYNLDHYDPNGEKNWRKMMSVSRKPFSDLSCSSNIRTNLEAEGDREDLTRIRCVNLRMISTSREK